VKNYYGDKMNKKKLGIVFLVLAIIFMAGTVFMVWRVQTNQETFDDNKKLAGYEDSPEGKDDQDQLDSQTMIRNVCGVFFIILLIIGLILFMKGKQDVSPAAATPPAGYQQQYPDQYQQQQQPYPQQYQPPPQYPQQPPQYPQQPPQNPPY